MNNLLVGIVLIGAGYYIYTQVEQNGRQVRMNPKHHVPMPHQNLGRNLNTSHSKSWQEQMKEYNPAGDLKKRHI